MNHDQNEPSLIDRALAADVGRLGLERVFEQLFKELKQNRLSHTKAVEAYLAAIDAAVWVCLQDSPLRRIVYRNFLIDGERQRRGQLFADAFMRATGANDQKAREASRVSPSDGSRNL
jgi:hypothetical protein